MNARKSLGLPTLVCRVDRLKPCVLWALDIAGSQGKRKHPRMKRLLGKLAALVGVFLHSAVDDDTLCKECNEQEPRSKTGRQRIMSMREGRMRSSRPLSPELGNKNGVSWTLRGVTVSSGPC